MSVNKKLQFIFLILFIYTTLFFGSFVFIQKDEYIHLSKQRYIQVALFLNEQLKEYPQNSFEKFATSSKINMYLNNIDMKIIVDKQHIDKLEKKGRLLFQENGANIIQYKIIALHAKFYLHMKHYPTNIWVKDKQVLSFFWKAIIVYLFFVGLLFLLYKWCMKSILALKILSKQVEKIRNGDLSISTKTTGKDEIGIIANTLDEALRRIEAMINTRQLFLRSIAHELNTPIAKGKLLVSLSENTEQQNEYNRIFERLEILVKEFFKIGQIFSSSYNVVPRTYYVADIAEQAIELLLLNSKEMKNIHTIYHDESQIHTDFDLTALAIKNLLDNALKYSNDCKVTIHIEKHGVMISSNGEQCLESLEPYCGPFHKEKKNSFGLGLYIVYSISKLLLLEFKYEYCKGQNCFSIYQKSFS